MPLFEYRCQACAHLEEVLQKHTDPAPAECPACGKAGTMAKAISITSFQLKGGGWYKDLYASSSTAPKVDGADQQKTDGADKKKADAATSSTATDAAKPAPASKPAEAKPATAAPSAPSSTTSASA